MSIDNEFEAGKIAAATGAPVVVLPVRPEVAPAAPAAAAVTKAAPRKAATKKKVASKKAAKSQGAATKAAPRKASKSGDAPAPLEATSTAA